jgi:hypothetical protein
MKGTDELLIYNDNVLWGKMLRYVRIVTRRGTMNDMDKLLEQAFEEMIKEGYDKRPKDLPRHQFSFEFRRKMKQVFQKFETQEKNGATKSDDSLLELYRPIRSKRRWIAVALLILMLVGGSVIAAEPIIQWLNGFRIEQRSDHVRIQNEQVQENEEEDRGDFRKYRLMEVSEGYTLESEKYEKEFQKYFVTYANSDEEVLFLKQVWQESRASENLTSDIERLEGVKMNGFTGYYTEDNGVGSLIISNGVYKLVLDGTFSKEELIKLAEKLELVDEPVY